MDDDTSSQDENEIESDNIQSQSDPITDALDVARDSLQEIGDVTGLIGIPDALTGGKVGIPGVGLINNLITGSGIVIDLSEGLTGDTDALNRAIDSGIGVVGSITNPVISGVISLHTNPNTGPSVLDAYSISSNIIDSNVDRILGGPNDTQARAIAGGCFLRD